AAFVVGQSLRTSKSVAAGPADVKTTRQGFVVSNEIKVTPQLAGKVKYVRVEEGAKVRKGQILAILEFDDSMAKCAAAEAELQAALRNDANVAQARAKVEA